MSTAWSAANKEFPEVFAIIDADLLMASVLAAFDPEHPPLLLPPQLLDPTPSRRHGVSAAAEDEYRFFACELLAEAGLLLELPQVVLATGQALVQRFYYRRSITQFDAHIVAMAALFLAAKVEEVPRRMRDILNVTYHLKLRRQGKADRPLVLGGSLYTRWKVELIKTERFILKELGFSLYNLMEHPHAFILYYVAALNGSATLANRAWAFLNDSLRLDLCVRNRAEAIACAAINLAARTTGEPLPRELPWWEVFGTTAAEMEGICEAMLRLYAVPHQRWLPPLRPGALPIEDMDTGEQIDGMPIVSAPTTSGSAASALQARIDASAAHFVAASTEPAGSDGVGDVTGVSSAGISSSSLSLGSVDAMAAARAAVDAAKAVAAARAAALAAAARAAGIRASASSTSGAPAPALPGDVSSTTERGTAAAADSADAGRPVAAASGTGAQQSRPTSSSEHKRDSRSRSRSRDREHSRSRRGASRDRSSSRSRDRRRHQRSRSRSSSRRHHDVSDSKSRDRHHHDDRHHERRGRDDYSTRGRDRDRDERHGRDSRRHRDDADRSRSRYYSRTEAERAGGERHRRGEAASAPSDDGGRWGQ